MPHSIGIATQTPHPSGNTVRFAFIYMPRGMVPCSDVSQELMEFNIVVLDAQLLDTAISSVLVPLPYSFPGCREICTFQGVVLCRTGVISHKFIVTAPATFNIQQRRHGM